MLIGIHPDQIGEESYSDKWKEFLEARGIEVCILNLLSSDALVQAHYCQGVMWRWAHNPQDKQSAKRILYTIEHQLGIPVFPNSHTAWHYDEKIAQHYLLQALAAPIPKTWLFWDFQEAMSWSQTASYPTVFKLSSGAGSSNVIAINYKEEAEEYIQKIFKSGLFPYTFHRFQTIQGWSPNWRKIKRLLRRCRAAWQYLRSNRYPPLPSTWWKPECSYAYFQEFLPGNEFDTRITVIGERAFGFRRLNRPGDFRASGSGVIDYDPVEIDPRCIEIAFRISRAGRFQSMAYDFLFSQGEPVIAEISYAFADSAVYACPGHWLEDITWVEGKMWPEEAQVDHFLNHIGSSN